MTPYKTLLPKLIFKCLHKSWTFYCLSVSTIRTSFDYFKICLQRRSMKFECLASTSLKLMTMFEFGGLVSFIVWFHIYWHLIKLKLITVCLIKPKMVVMVVIVFNVSCLFWYLFSHSYLFPFKSICAAVFIATSRVRRSFLFILFQFMKRLYI